MVVHAELGDGGLVGLEGALEDEVVCIEHCHLARGNVVGVREVALLTGGREHEAFQGVLGIDHTKKFKRLRAVNVELAS